MGGYQRRGTSFIGLEVLHIILSLLIILLTVVAFVSPQEHMLFFPTIFTLFAVYNFLEAYQNLKDYTRSKSRMPKATLQIVLGVFMVLLAIVGILNM